MRVLITGGTGYFGKAFTKHMLALGHTVCIYSRGEFSQFLMRQSLGDDQNMRWFIGDVRDQKRLRRAMHGCDWVVHAAALKRIEVGHYNPTEMVNTNVIGTMNVCEAASDAGVSKVVFLSSDKAYQPVSAYGQSKALAESIVLSSNYTMGANGPIFAVTRYGNVANSTGSVIPIWREALRHGPWKQVDGKMGRSVNVTDPECTRFYMTEQQAVDLVRETLETMSGGELVIPEYLPAYRLGDLAEAMGATMNITGLSKFEKLHEGMRDGLTSDIARRMTIDELKEAISVL